MSLDARPASGDRAAPAPGALAGSPPALAAPRAATSLVAAEIAGTAGSSGSCAQAGTASAPTVAIPRHNRPARVRAPCFAEPAPSMTNGVPRAAECSYSLQKCVAAALLRFDDFAPVCIDRMSRTTPGPSQSTTIVTAHLAGCGLARRRSESTGSAHPIQRCQLLAQRRRHPCRRHTRRKAGASRRTNPLQIRRALILDGGGDHSPCRLTIASKRAAQ